jgi:hypothetical protein
LCPRYRSIVSANTDITRLEIFDLRLAFISVSATVALERHRAKLMIYPEPHAAFWIRYIFEVIELIGFHPKGIRAVRMASINTQQDDHQMGDNVLCLDLFINVQNMAGNIPTQQAANQPTTERFSTHRLIAHVESAP